MPISKLEVSVSDLTKRPRVQITQGDRRSRVIEATVTDGGRPMDLTGKRARFRAELPLGKVVIDDGCEVADAEAGVIRYTVGDEVAARAAVISDAYFEIYDEEGYSLAESKMVVEVGRGVDVDGERPSDYVPELDRLKGELARIAEKAESAATKAENAAAAAVASIGNVLVGEASGTLAHAEDAFAGAGIRRLTVEGACKQDGTPSPENPVPIEVVENPVVKVVGRNLLDISKVEANASAPYGLNISVDGDYVIVKGTASGISDEVSTPSFALGWYADTSLSGKGLNIKLFGAPDNVTAYGLRTSGETQIAVSTRLRNGDNVDWKMQIAVSQNALAEYKPHTSQNVTFALPAEHPYLAKLPDGTADEIVVDQEGNVELAARVGKVVFDGSQAFYEVQNGDIETYYETSNPIGTGMLDVAQWGGLFDRFETGNPYSQHSAICAYSFANINGVVFRIRPSETFVGADAFENWLKSNPVTSYYADPEPKTFQLGKIDMPKAQDNIVNVWTEAEVTPRTGIGYVRDVNIVVANLEAAIASIS